MSTEWVTHLMPWLLTLPCFSFHSDLLRAHRTPASMCSESWGMSAEAIFQITDKIRRLGTGRCDGRCVMYCDSSKCAPFVTPRSGWGGGGLLTSPKEVPRACVQQRLDLQQTLHHQEHKQRETGMHQHFPFRARLQCMDSVQPAYGGRVSE
jgi:hypothetical protein